MTHQNHQTNGASLEDCHTNFFALTELYGIKWRKLVWVETNGGGGAGVEEDGSTPLTDPVISSYARCLAGDILCVWRRVPTPHAPIDCFDMSIPAPPPPPPLSLRAAKELWIFWYGEEPDLNGLVAPELIASQGEQGSWESGLSYECRSLLFKALHNLIERCLLSRDFVRLGKWFVQPYDGDEEDVEKSPWHLSFSFAFFLHGESTVCASVDVRQHPPVRTLTAKRLARLNAPDHVSDKENKVILAPFGLEGTLTGREWNDTDPATGRLLDAWRQLYPLEQGCSALEVVCSGVRMKYPLPYVLMTDMQPCTTAPHGTHGPHGAHSSTSATPAHRPSAALATHTFAALTTPAPHLTAELCYRDISIDKSEDFVDPMRKTNCTCTKWRRKRSGRASRQQPFHRRQHGHHRRQHLSVPVNGIGACSPGSCGGASPAHASAPPSPHHAPHVPDIERDRDRDIQTASVPASLHTPAPTPDSRTPPTPAPPHPLAHLPPALAQGQSSPNGVGHERSSVGASGNSSGPAPGEPPGIAELLKRPSLPSPPSRPDPMEDEHSLAMLYDYTTVHAWLEHPVKRFKVEENHFKEELALGSANSDLYAGHNHTKMAKVENHLLDIKQEKQEHNDDMKEYKNLFTSDGLYPTFKDLDQIFENSDDASGDETVRLLHAQTPPDKSMEERGRYVRPEELSKMFPTPPSMEAHAQPSPGFSLPEDGATTHLLHHSHHTHHALTTLSALNTHHPHHVLSAHPGASTPPIEPIEDWSYVFKPPTVAKYVGSSKYAPLTTLPSDLLPPIVLPPHAIYRPRWQHNTNKHHAAGTKRNASPVRSPREQVVSRAGTPAFSGTGIASVGSCAPRTPRTPRTPATPGSRANIPAPSPAPPPVPPVPPPSAPVATVAATACPLLVNVLLTDTVLNIFRDHNFDSCTLCVCNATPRVVGNIRGADAATYLMEQSPGSDEEPPNCSCGFSAVINRRLAHRAGLFYEDEMEITGVAEEAGGRADAKGRLADVADTVLAMCGPPATSASSALARAARLAAAPAQHDDTRLSLLEYSDGGAAATRALRAATGCLSGGIDTSSAVHRWPFIGARAPSSSRDVVRLMRRLRPLLQDAIQKRCCGARMWDGVSGPLTWRQFHRLAGRGNEDLCEPQPVPLLLVGHDRDWISLSPYALRHWERLALEPYAFSRDVAYIVLAPEGETLTDPLKTFFRELSAAYEALRLGRHRPISRIAKDGLVRSSCGEVRDGDYEEWIGDIPPGRLGEYMKSYVESLRSTIVPHLSSLNLDRSLFELEKTSLQERVQPSPSTPDHPPTPSSQSDQEESTSNTPSSVCGGGNGGGITSGGSYGSWEAEEGGTPALVVYVVEPPAAQANRARSLHALLRLAAQTYHRLQHHNPLVKIISLDGVYETWGVGVGRVSEVRALALSVFTSARRLLQHTADGKSLTGFGTAARANLLIESKDEKNRAPYKLFSPAWILAPPRVREVPENWGQCTSEQSSVLFLCYCLSHDQRWLLACATDARGELLDTTAINVHVPARSRRRRCAAARRMGLTKLMDFTLGVMSQAAQPWRLVVGRVGRIGHGELKSWSWLLSKKNLVRASNALRSSCGGCGALYPAGAPCILSACLVSTEPDPAMRLMPDRFTPDERFSQASIQSHLHTPRDVTATHILVFPTSATTQSNQRDVLEPLQQNEDNMDMLLDMDINAEDINDDHDMMSDIGDMFTSWLQSPKGRHDADEDGADGAEPGDGSPARHHHHTTHFAEHPDHNMEQVGNVLQQPLALGYMVSTAPLGGMPAWWWAGCGHLRDACPAFIKNALHLHAGSVQTADDFSFAPAPQRRDHNAHPLDSTTTTDVLRYVLEGYNALSWLSLDGNTHDRLSCLPLHVQVLMQLYHTASALG